MAETSQEYQTPDKTDKTPVFHVDEARLTANFLRDAMINSLSNELTTDRGQPERETRRSTERRQEFMQLESDKRCWCSKRSGRRRYYLRNNTLHQTCERIEDLVVYMGGDVSQTPIASHIHNANPFKEIRFRAHCKYGRFKSTVVQVSDVYI